MGMTLVRRVLIAAGAPAVQTPLMQATADPSGHLRVRVRSSLAALPTVLHRGLPSPEAAALSPRPGLSYEHEYSAGGSDPSIVLQVLVRVLAQVLVCTESLLLSPCETPSTKRSMLRVVTVPLAPTCLSGQMLLPPDHLAPVRSTPEERRGPLEIGSRLAV